MKEASLSNLIRLMKIMHPPIRRYPTVVLLTLLPFLVFFYACKSSSKIALTSGQATWQQEILADREAKDREFKTSPTSPMAAVDRYTLHSSQGGWITVSKGGVALSNEPVHPSPLSFVYRDRWYWKGRAELARSAETAAHPVPGPVTDGVLFQLERFTLSPSIAGTQLVLLVFDPHRSMIQSFQHLLYYPPDRSYAVRARLERLNPVIPVSMLTSRNLEKQVYRYADLHFPLGNSLYTLQAFKMSLEGPESKTLFIPFKDLTSGKETYGAGRFLEIPEPSSEELDLDFNQAFNPLCNYSPSFNCPIPPAENRLPIAIRAGEKTYPH